MSNSGASHSTTRIFSHYGLVITGERVDATTQRRPRADSTPANDAANYEDDEADNQHKPAGTCACDACNQSADYEKCADSFPSPDRAYDTDREVAAMLRRALATNRSATVGAGSCLIRNGLPAFGAFDERHCRASLSAWPMGTQDHSTISLKSPAYSCVFSHADSPQYRISECNCVSRLRASDRGERRNMPPRESHMWRKRRGRPVGPMWSGEGPIECRQHER